MHSHREDRADMACKKICLEYQSFLVKGFVSSALQKGKAKAAQADLR